MNTKLIANTILSLSVVLGMASVTAEGLISVTKTFKHNNSGGGSGVDSIRLTAPKTSKNSCAVFVNAQIHYTKRHYGKVEITEQPKAQCNPKTEQCKLSISWKHSPAGRLDYKVKVSWATKPCN